MEIPFGFAPMHDWVVLRPIEDPTSSEPGKLVTMDRNKGLAYIWGEVVQTGEGGMYYGGKVVPLDVKVGDRAMFGHAAAVTIQRGGETLYIVQEAYIPMIFVS
jgi:chaperonin GroES